MHREPRLLRLLAHGCRWRLAAPLLIGALLCGCAAPQIPWQSSALASMRVASLNANERRPTLIILHHTGEDSFVHALATLTDPRSQVSAHYLISRDGRIAQLVDERERAWHAGAGRWGPINDVNSVSIGIELDNDGKSPFADQQISSLIALLHDLIGRYRIDPRNVIGHADITPRRKDDPSVFFPWSRLAAEGIGLWCGQPDQVTVPVVFDDASALRQIGYQVDSEEQFSAARMAFRRHFLAAERDGAFNPHERAVLACIADQQASAALS